MPLPEQQAPNIVISAQDVEREVSRLFGQMDHPGLVITVHDNEAGGAQARDDAFRELLESLALYDDRYRPGGEEITVPPPDVESIKRGLSVLGAERLKRQLFKRILMTFGKHIVDPLAAILDATPGGALYSRMGRLRDELLASISELRLTYETQQIIVGDVRQLLGDDYLKMLAEHEERVQRPRVEELAQQVLHLVGSTFQEAFRHWPEHASRIAEGVARRLGTQLTLRESPLVIRDRIVEGIEEFLWIETSTEISGALHLLMRQPKYQGLTDGDLPEVGQQVYHEFAMACWELVEQNC